MDAFLSTEGLLSLATLTAMEIVLGIDNVVFIAILVARLPAAQQALARRLGLILALGMRIALLFTITWMMGLTRPFFEIMGHGVSGRDLILLGGGVFLIQIILLDIVFSLDSVITAVGMANRLSVMVTAMVLAMLVMLWAAGPVSSFVEHRPSVKILALAFLLLIGVMLVAEGMGSHI